MGLTHELYLLLAEVSDCLGVQDDGQIRQWRLGTLPPAFAHGPVTVSRLRPGRLSVSVPGLRLRDDHARARFRELVAASRCHPALWDVDVSTDAGAGTAELDALAAEGFTDLDPEMDTDGDSRAKHWNLALRD